jgi:DNA-binding transcriptional MerR regulator
VKVEAVLATEIQYTSRPEGRTGTLELQFTLKELAKAAEISERTIRYYIQEGVLPPPLGAGPASRYGLEHLSRLLLVRRFKAALLPLSQIKQLFAELSLDDLEAIADHYQAELTNMPTVLDEAIVLPKERAEPDAEVELSLENILRERSAPPPTYPGELTVFSLPQETPVLLGDINEPLNLQQTVSPNVLEDIDLNIAGRWNRIMLAPGLELSYQEGGLQDTPQGRQRLASLLELAKQLYF